MTKKRKPFDDPDIPPDEMQRLREMCKRNAEAISGFEIFVCMFNEKMVVEVVPLVQMGLAVYLDKPLYILVPDSRVLAIPENLKRMARGLEVYTDGDDESFQQATMRLMDGAVGKDGG